MNTLSENKILNTLIIHGIYQGHLVYENPELPNIRLSRATYTAFRKLCAAALKDGINLKAASGYRDFDRQNKIFTDKLTGRRKVLDRSEKTVDLNGMSEEKKIETVLLFSAAPGFSRHHYGTDIDVYSPDLIPEGGELELTNREYLHGPQAPVSNWLTSNMEEFGFFRPYREDTELNQGELWHISFGPEADQLTQQLDAEESLEFLKRQNIYDGELLGKIMMKNFAERLRIFSKMSF